MGHQINIVSTDRANVVASAAIGAREGTTPQSTRLTAGRESWDRRALDPSRHLAFTSNEQVTYMASETDSPDILLRCALDLFGRHGFDGTSTRAIAAARSEEHTSELQSLMRISYAVFCLKKKNDNTNTATEDHSRILLNSLKRSHPDT